jgi:membrane protease YdiL (CAAX protease family)
MASVPPPVAPTVSAPPPDPPELPEGAPRPAPRWPPWTAPVALIAGFGAAIFAYVLLGVVAAAAGADPDHPPSGVDIAATVIQDLALIGSAVVFARMTSRPRPWHFGLRPTRWGVAVAWVVTGFVAFIVFSAIWVTALGIHQRDDLPKQLGAGNGPLALAAVALLVCVIAPIAEEFFFRGYFFTALRSWKGVWPAAIITGVVFGAIHAGSAPVGYLVPLAVFGIVLCVVYWRTGSLYPCISLHALNNSLAFGVTQHWGWQIPLVMLGSHLAIAAVLLPVGRRSRLAPA